MYAVAGVVVLALGFGGALLGEKPARLAPPPTFISVHTKRVRRSMHLLGPVLTSDDLPIDQRRHQGQALPDAPPASFAAVTAPTIDPLDHLRLRDRLRLLRSAGPEGRNLGFGMALFGATTILAAHLPSPLRLIFDAPVHLGPALLGDGGYGAGVGGQWM